VEFVAFVVLVLFTAWISSSGGYPLPGHMNDESLCFSVGTFYRREN